jgi:hypothetical protein
MPSADVQAEYYAALIKRVRADVRVRDEGAPRGRVTYAARTFAAGELMWKEPPVLAMQDVESRQYPLLSRVCGHCLAFLGTAGLQFAHYDHVLRPTSCPPVGYGPDVAVECGFQCGELYCGEGCRAAAFEQHHRLLCVGPLTEKHPLVLFKRRAIECSDLFLFAALGLCKVLCTAFERRVSLDEARLPFAMFHRRPWKELARERQDTTVARFETMLNECFALLRKGLLQVAKELQPDMLPIIKAGCTLEAYTDFFEFFDCNVQGVGIASPLARLWTQQKLGQRIADIEGPHETLAYKADPDQATPELFARVEALAEELYALPTEDELHGNDDDDDDGIEVAASSSSAAAAEPQAPKKTYHLRNDGVVEADSTADGHDHDHDHNDDGDDDENEHSDAYIDEQGRDLIDGPFARLEGMGLFPLSATVNHSCVPNCVVTFNRNFEAYVYARRAIKEGDELFHTYVQETDTLENRRAELKLYGFTCRCLKCVEEEKEQG